MYIFDALLDLLNRIISLLFWKESTNMNPNKTQIFVKCGPEKIIPVVLEMDWTVLNLKEAIASNTDFTFEDLRIIFAGKELDDSVKLQDCDVGDQSVIHAVAQKKQVLKNENLQKNPLNHMNFCCDSNDVDLYSRKSHFYVYCSSVCKALSPGKLRVRCATCKEGTLTVNQDPTCWDDVLIQGKVNGLCQSESCDGTIAEFFFKCSRHASSPNDTYVPLYLVRNNFKKVPCIACTGEGNLVLVFPCADRHVICLDCFQMYCISRLNERRFKQDDTVGYTIDCPAGCPDSLIKEPHHFKLLGDEQYERYQRFGAEEYLLLAGGVLCPQPGCGAGLLPDAECKRVTCLKEGGVGCGFVFCRYCMQGYHLGDCDSQDKVEEEIKGNYVISDERARTSKWDEASKKVIQTISKPCPSCRTPTERDGGCMHMVCTRSQCGFHWCWVCQESWTNECMGNHWFG